MLNVYEQVDQNKKRSLLVIVFFVIFVSAIIWFIGQFLGSDQNTIVVALVFSLFSSLAGYLWGDKFVLAVSKAKPANRQDHFNFYTAAENLAITAQIPMPQLYVIESPAMNAFATGKSPQKAVICATTGLLNNLDKSETEAVIAHELGHIINYDILLATLVAVLVGTVSLLSDWILRSGLGSKKKKNRNDNPLIFVLGLVALILSPIIAKLIQLALSRQREYLADSSGVKLTRQPESLISALKKLSSSNIPLVSASTSTAHLFITNPFANFKKGLSKIATLFSTHPPIEQRIGRLEKML